MNISKKKIGVGFCVLIFLMLFVLAVNGGGTHSGSKTFVTINGHAMSLQEAVGNNYLKDYGPGASSAGSSQSNAYHDASEIIVTVGSSTSTLAQAIKSGNNRGLCPATSSLTDTPSISFGHDASEITLSSGKSLQQTINDNDFCCVPSSCGGQCGTVSDGCGSTINCGACCVPSGCGGQCGSVGDGCGGTIYCGECPLSCGAIGGTHCYQSGGCKWNQVSAGTSYDCNYCCKVTTNSCGGVGGNWCGSAGSSCPAGKSPVGVPVYDCPVCCK